jgi:isoaspartyl peptidase/L-asparaginase-like protein (Ntn-hydrolase superfamily)
VVATPAKIAYWQERIRGPYVTLDYAGMGADWKSENPRLGTVGCVALDASGRLAAATSTGGTGQCYPGRIGDTPVIGAGTYATPQVAVSLTGVGERILVLLCAKRLCDLVKDGRSVDEAGRVVLAELDAINGAAGMIALDASGRFLSLRNTPFMAEARRGEAAG